MWPKTKEYGLNSKGYSKEQEWAPVVEKTGKRVITEQTGERVRINTRS